MNIQPDLETTVQERLSEIKEIPARNPQVAAHARAQFLRQAVSAGELQRHKGWISIFRKEQFVMNILLSILVIAGLLFGGGAIVNAAQDELPNEPLYLVKTFSEDVGLQFQSNPEEKVDRLIELAQIRAQEMKQLTAAGQASPDQVRQRLEQHLQQALQICSNMDEQLLDQTLLQLRAHLQQQDRDLEQLQLHAPQEAQPLLQRTHTMLRQRLQLVEDGLLDHEMFRNAARDGFNYKREQTPPPVLTSTPHIPAGQQNGQFTPQADPDNGNGLGSNTPSGEANHDMTPGPSHEGNGSGNNQMDGSGSGGNQPDTNEPDNVDSAGNGSGGNESGGNGSGTDSGGNGFGADDHGGNGSGGNKP